MPQMPPQMQPSAPQDGQQQQQQPPPQMQPPYYPMPSQTPAQYGQPPTQSGPAPGPAAAPYGQQQAPAHMRPQQYAPHMAMHMYSQQMHPGGMYGQLPMHTQYPVHPLHMQSGMAMPPYMGIPHYIDPHTGMAVYPGAMGPHQANSDADLVLQSANRPVNKRWVLEPEDVLLLERIFALEKLWFQNRRQRTKGSKGKDGSEAGAPGSAASRIPEWNATDSSNRNESERRADLLIKLLNGSYPGGGSSLLNGNSGNESADGLQPVVVATAETADQPAKSLTM
ncbi:MAG: hypothetical protein SGPRY_011004, partial [Prymnesium sp.]